ncbi:MAG: 30S ribosomal protein S16 [Caldilineaceae bacterium]|nr:30S ribosomal protein S16 [Caldilineaceae bacterium]
MVRIRLRRMGAKKKPYYRIVVANQQSSRNGRFIETIGTYDPLTEPETVSFDEARAAHWLSVGAQPSDAVARFLRKANLLDESGKAIGLAEAAEDAASASTDAAEPSVDAEPSVEVEPVGA